MSGFIQLSREFFKTKEWREGRNLSDAEAMLYMISKAGFEAKTALVKGKYIHLQVGELMASERFLAEEWSWDKMKVARFLRRMLVEGHISRRVEKGVGLIKVKRLIIRRPFEAGNEAESEAEKQGYNPLDISELPYSCDSEVRQQMRQETRQARGSHEPPINNKENNKNNENKGRENPPSPPFSEKGKSDFSFESPEKEELALNTEGEEKEKSCGQKEKEEQGDLKPYGGLDGDLWRHYPTQERKSILEAPNGLKTAPGPVGQPAKAVQKAKRDFSGASHQQKLFGEVRYPFDSEKFTKAWGLWKRYKREEHGFKYKSALSEQVALNALYKLSRGDQAKALSIIEQSIANGWEGLFELKNPSREQGDYPSALEKLKSDQVLFEGFAMKYVSQLTRDDFEHFCQQWDLKQKAQGDWHEKAERQLLASLEKYLGSIIYRLKRENTPQQDAIDISKSTIRKLG